jgi:tetratricopeptide (TPR) repeat protein
LNPELVEAHLNLGVALMAKTDVVPAITSFRRAIDLRPDSAKAHYNLALALLSSGNFREGWTENEWRWLCKGFTTPLRRFTQPLWDGSPLHGRTILLHCEQGFGDSIQFIRYAPLVAERGGRVVLWAPPELLSLMRGVQGVETVATAEPFPPFDVHCPLLSLPRALDTRLESIPANVPYLFADPVRTARWKDKVVASANGLKIGLAWAGRPTHTNDRNRSIGLKQLAPLAEITGVTFYSLQKGSSAHHAAGAPSGMNLIDLTDELHDFADTAALIENLDMVIAVDTSVAHLAGAMGKRVWVLLPFSADWRWLLNREDNPWYPTMRLFRQKQIGNWDATIIELARALKSQVKT